MRWEVCMFSSGQRVLTHIDGNFYNGRDTVHPMYCKLRKVCWRFLTPLLSQTVTIVGIMLAYVYFIAQGISYSFIYLFQYTFVQLEDKLLGELQGICNNTHELWKLSFSDYYCVYFFVFISFVCLSVCPSSSFLPPIGEKVWQVKKVWQVMEFPSGTGRQEKLTSTYQNSIKGSCKVWSKFGNASCR